MNLFVLLVKEINTNVKDYENFEVFVILNIKKVLILSND